MHIFFLPGVVSKTSYPPSPLAYSSPSPLAFFLPRIGLLGGGGPSDSSGLGSGPNPLIRACPNPLIRACPNHFILDMSELQNRKGLGAATPAGQAWG